MTPTWHWIVLLFLGIALIAASVMVLLKFTREGVVYQKVSFTTQGLEEKPVKVSGLLMKPAPGTPGEVNGKRPGVVFAHGVTGSKEWYIQMTRPMVQNGFVVLSIDLRGHGGTDGHCAFGIDEVREVWAAADFMRTSVPEVEPNRIVAMGHSLGGITVTRAGALQPDNRISATIAIYSWTSWKDALEDLLGPIDNFLGRAWRFTGFSKHLDVNAPNLERVANMLDIVSANRPPNYLLEVGRMDELVSVDREEQLMEAATAEARRTGPQKKVVESYSYGSFADGTARKLVLSFDDHVSELVSGVLVIEAIDWVKLNFGVAPDTSKGSPILWGRVGGLIALVLGLMFLSMGVMSLSRAYIFPHGVAVEVDPPWGATGEQGIWELSLYAVAILAASYLAMPFAKAFSVKPFIPYEVINELSVFFLSRTAILVPALVVLAVIVVKKTGAKTFTDEQLREVPARWGKSIGYALIPIVIVMVATIILSGPLLLPRALPMLPVYPLLGVVLIGAGLWSEDYVFYKIAYPALTKKGVHRERFAVLVHGIVLDLVVVFALLPLVKGIGTYVRIFTLKVPLLLLILLATPAFIVMADLSMRLRRLTGGSLAYALMLTTIMAWLFTAPIGVRSF